MHPDEREEMELQMLYAGRSYRAVQSEQAGRELRAQMADDSDREWAAITEALAAGKFVVQARIARFGPFDEILFHSTHFVAAFDSREEAEAGLAEITADSGDEMEYYHEIAGPPAEPATRPSIVATDSEGALGDLDIPF